MTNNLWKEIKRLKGETLRTLSRRKPFDVLAITKSVVIVVPHSTGKERPVQRAGIENAYQHLLVTGELTLSDIEEKFTPYSPV